MSWFLADALVIGLKEGLKLGVVWLVFVSWATWGPDGSPARRKQLVPWFFGAVGVASLFGLLSFFIPGWTEQRVLLSKLTGFAFFLSFLAGLVAMYTRRRAEAPADPLHAPPAAPPPRWAGPAVFLCTAAYFAPDILGSSLFVSELARMGEHPSAVYPPGAAAFVVSVAAVLLLFRRGAPRLGRLFGLGQLFVFLALIKLVAGGHKGFGELSLIPAVQEGVVKFVHDFVHQVFLILQAPDHTLLGTTAWDFIAALFSAKVGVVVGLSLLILPLLAYTYESLTTPVPLLAGELPGPDSRKRRAAVRAAANRRLLPVLAFVVVVLTIWVFGAGERGADLFLPDPRPVLADQGHITIPVNEPGSDLYDGELHKFSYTLDGQNVRMLAIKRLDGTLAVTLDACEICPPEGYARQGQDLICLYCNTPIALDTVGHPGGCNPIPLDVEIDQHTVRLSIDELKRKWSTVNSQEGSE